MKVGRKQRNTVEYFPHFVRDSKTKAILKNKFGLEGYAIWFQLLELLCKSQDHYCDLRDEINYEWLLSEIGAEKETFEGVVDFLVRVEKIDKELWEHKIIWCQNLVDNLERVYQKRVSEIPQKPLFLLPKPQKEAISGTEIDNSGTEIQQREVKRSTVKKSKEKKDYAENSTEFQLTEFCISEIKKNHPHLKFDAKSKQDFCDMFDKLIRIDKKTEADIKDAINFATHHQGNNGFCWRDQFQSPLKLRRKTKDEIMFIDYWIGLANKKQSTKGYHSAEQDGDIYDNL